MNLKLIFLVINNIYVIKKKTAYGIVFTYSKCIDLFVFHEKSLRTSKKYEP